MKSVRTGLSFVDVSCFLLPISGCGELIQEFGFDPKKIKPQKDFLALEKP